MDFDCSTSTIVWGRDSKVEVFWFCLGVFTPLSHRVPLSRQPLPDIKFSRTWLEDEIKRHWYLRGCGGGPLQSCDDWGLWPRPECGGEEHSNTVLMVMEAKWWKHTDYSCWHLYLINKAYHRQRKRNSETGLQEEEREVEDAEEEEEEGETEERLEKLSLIRRKQYNKHAHGHTTTHTQYCLVGGENSCLCSVSSFCH